MVRPELALWDEIDMDVGGMDDPRPERMKTGREHRVPLSPEAVQVLKAAEVISGPKRAPLRLAAWSR